MRIAVGGIATESCTFSPVPTTLDDFHVLAGPDLLASQRYPFMAALRAEFIPTLYAHALPGGPVESGTYQALKKELLERLATAGPLQGIYLDLHGAMYVQGMEDAEHDLAASIRKIVGPDVPMAASMDLHGNISRAYAAQIDMLSAYRTAPHEDTVETRERACRMLVRCIETGIRPEVYAVPIPVALPGERTTTDVEPGRSLWASLDRVDEAPGVLDASLFVGYAWADEPRVHATAVVTGIDGQVLRREAGRIARAYWDARHDFQLGVPSGTIDECIQRALAAQEAPVFISDSGDNPTAGAAGDIPLFLERLLAQQVPDAVLASIPDPRAIAVCQRAGVGATVSVSLGGKLDPVHGRPLATTGEILHLSDGDPAAGVQAVLRCGGVKAIITQRRKPFVHLDDFRELGIDPLEHKIVVVKLGYLFPELRKAAALALMALSPGASNLDIAGLPFRRVQRPLFPLDEAMEWQADPSA